MGGGRMDSVLGSWPLAAVVCFTVFSLIFRSPIDGLIRRVKGVKVGEHSVDASGDVSQQQQKKIETTVTPTTPSNAHTLPMPSEIYAPLEKETRDALAVDSLPHDVEKAWLLRVVAVWRVWHGHEKAYRLITGSQLELLLRANTAPLKMDMARQMYEAAKANYPDMYREFSFETWVTFPINAGLLREEASVLRITLLGQDFLHYLVSNSLTNPKPG
jgi:hypothetical protein